MAETNKDHFKSLYWIILQIQQKNKLTPDQTRDYEHILDSTEKFEESLKTGRVADTHNTA